MISHGLSKTRFYHIYGSIANRCNDKNVPNYGAKGIKCLWESFEQFRDDMYESYLKHCEEFGEKQTTIDRINSRGNYCKENCRWATYTVQNNNARRNRTVEYNGQKKTLSEWAAHLGLDRQTLYMRVFVYKMDITRAFTKGRIMTWTVKKKLN